MQQQSERIPPQALEEEIAIIGACLADISEFKRATAVITDHLAFYSDKNRIIWNAMTAVAERDMPVDVLTLHAELRDRGKLETIGGMEFLREINDVTVGLGNVEWYARIVVEKHARRQCIAIASALQRDAWDTDKPFNESAGLAVNKLLEVQSVGKKKRARHIKDWCNDFMDRLESGPLRKKSDSPKSGFSGLDEFVGGFDPGYLTYLAARPGEGKSTLCGQISRNIASKGPVVLFSNELEGHGVIGRLVCADSLVASKVMNWGPHEAFTAALPNMTASVAKLAGTNLYMADEPMSVAEIRIICQDVMAKEGKPLSAIILDRIELLEGLPKNSRQYEKITEASRQVKNLAKELRTHCIVVAQFKRPDGMRVGQRPQLTDLRDSGALEQDAQIVIAIHHEEFDESTQEGLADVCVLKNTGGPKGSVQFVFKAMYPAFFEIAKEEYNR